MTKLISLNEQQREQIIEYLKENRVTASRHAQSKPRSKRLYSTIMKRVGFLDALRMLMPHAEINEILDECYKRLEQDET